MNHRLDELNNARAAISRILSTSLHEESAAFVLEHLPKAGVLASPRHAAVRAGRDWGSGLALEFGVAAGTTLKIIAEGASSDRTVVGFDILTGLPETWRTGFR